MGRIEDELDPQFAKDMADMTNEIATLRFELETEREKIEVLETALMEIYNWSMAYPIDVFPEPDMKKARNVLKDAGMTIDSIAGEVARRIVAGVGKIAEDALNINYKIAHEFALRMREEE